jgi:hypothetical protein
MQTSNIPPPIAVQPPTAGLQKPRRPLSHNFVICYLCLLTATWAIILVMVVSGRSGASFKLYWLPITFLTGAAFALFCLLVGGRHRWAYYVTSVVTGVWTLHGVYKMIANIWLFASGTGPITAPYFHLAERHRPYSNWQLLAIAQQLIAAAVAGALVWLFVQFTFGAESRGYFQLKKRTGNHVPAALRV